MTEHAPAKTEKKIWEYTPSDIPQVLNFLIYRIYSIKSRAWNKHRISKVKS